MVTPFYLPERERRGVNRCQGGGGHPTSKGVGGGQDGRQCMLHATCYIHVACRTRRYDEVVRCDDKDVREGYLCQRRNETPKILSHLIESQNADYLAGHYEKSIRSDSA